MKKGIILLVAAVLSGGSAAHAVVVLNEVFINPEGSSYDDTREFIELMGTPGKKLDGYAIALANGTLQKYWPEGAAYPVDQEIDEFFSLDGLALGDNGLLVIAVGIQYYNSTLLPDTRFQRWNTIWNGGLDTPGKLQNDGSNTILLIRNRPGKTQADPAGTLSWGKDISHDEDHFTHVEDPSTPAPPYFDQWGDGNFDKGAADDPATPRDMKGASTPMIDDDLEVVDEVSYEHERGWEYDLDGRHVDSGSLSAGLPYRHVHALDDPQGFNPDALSRVDYRTKGPGWTPAPGAVGEMANGSNWQDTATEQWIRGENDACLSNCTGEGNTPQFYFSNLANDNPDAIQPYATNVPRWLDDGAGDDYDFLTTYSYQIMPGRVNPLAVLFIPGDCDRDGDTDADDIATIAAVFGDADWIFSNSFAESPEGDSGDPAEQTRPWDVDATGDNGIEASDLQWTLNFQGDTTGRIVGVTYDSTTPSVTGVYLNDNSAVACSVTASFHAPSGRPLSGLHVGDLVEMTVAAEVTGGANTAAGQENGIMQFVQDALIGTGGVLRINGVSPQGVFATTRVELQTPAGNGGDEGLATINGHTTNFTQGLGSPVDLYMVTLEAVGIGSAEVTVAPASAARFAAGTSGGLKVGHTRQQGNPDSVAYPAAEVLTVSGGPAIPGDTNGDGDVDGDDYIAFENCASGPMIPYAGGCGDLDFDADNDIDHDDFGVFQRCLSGENIPGDQQCAD